MPKELYIDLPEPQGYVIIGEVKAEKPFEIKKKLYIEINESEWGETLNIIEDKSTIFAFVFGRGSYTQKWSNTNSIQNFQTQWSVDKHTNNILTNITFNILLNKKNYSYLITRKDSFDYQIYRMLESRL